MYRLNHFFLCVSAAVWLCTAWAKAETQSTPAVAAPTNITIPPSSIGFSSALRHEASAVVESDYSASSDAQETRFYPTSIPQNEVLNHMVPLLPPMQVGLELPDAEDLKANLTSSPSERERIGINADSLLARQDALRVMIVGDSISQGQEGDWTWRYRIWQWFQENEISAQFVGPYKGTVEPEEAEQPQPPPLYGTTPVTLPPRTSGGYAKGVDSRFLSNCNHFCVWGRAAAVDKGIIRETLTQNPADLMLLMLGFNDIGWFYTNAYGTIDSIATIIDEARETNPKMKFVVGNIIHRTFIGGREDLVANTDIINDMLPEEVENWSTSESPVYLADIAKYYDCRPGGCPAGYDGLHPNAWGEYQIAHGFSKTLVNKLNMGSKPLAIPSQIDASLARNLPVPSNFRVFSSPQGVTATWDPVYGAYSYDMKVSINGGDNGFSGLTASFNRWDSHWPIDGWNYAVSVRASAGDNIKGSFTGTLTAEAKPQLAPPPQNVNVKATEAGFTVTWDNPKGLYTDSIDRYNIIYWDWKSDHCSYLNGAAFESSPGKVTGLPPRINYLIALVTWNENGEGFPILVSNAVPGYGTPETPSGVKVDTIDATSVRITWDDVGPEAGGYRVWSRNINEKDSKFQVIANVTMGSLCNEEYFIFPGVWNYAFAVSAFNGDNESGRSSGIIASKPTSDTPQDFKCPAQPVWCPGGGEVDVPGNPGDPGTPTDPDDPDETQPPTSTGIPNVACFANLILSSPLTDELCASYGCIGDDCFDGRCLGDDYVEGCTRPSDASTSTSTSCEMPVVTNTWSPGNSHGAIPVLGAGGNLGNIEITGDGAKLTLTVSSPPSGTSGPPGGEPTGGNPPSEKNHRVIINLERIPSGGEIGGTDAWVVFERMLEDPPVQVCNTRPLSTTYIYTDDIGTYPAVDLGPFTAYGKSGCKYNANNKDIIGTLSCQGVSGISCERNDEEDVYCDLGAVIKSSLVCTW
ncbi:carbohydrate esterase family 3 [Fusarium globosum]|uniref:Carbohydrate esterase family 3 n=1 Tax=Fusarium globosum TaxID=78864 RepID=A0A8H5X9M8_9HYPO|nr:carbohydrate esterase family 3 [Fusarium globosum]